jgi:hypothetical protein
VPPPWGVLPQNPPPPPPRRFRQTVAHWQDVSTLNAVLALGGDPARTARDRQHPEEYTALQAAIHGGSVEGVAVLLAHSRTQPDAAVPWWWYDVRTPLMMATYLALGPFGVMASSAEEYLRRRLAIVRLLLGHSRVDDNTALPDGTTALLVAAQQRTEEPHVQTFAASGHLRTVRALGLEMFEAMFRPDESRAIVTVRPDAVEAFEAEVVHALVQHPALVLTPELVGSLLQVARSPAVLREIMAHPACSREVRATVGVRALAHAAALATARTLQMWVVDEGVSLLSHFRVHATHSDDEGEEEEEEARGDAAAGGGEVATTPLDWLLYPDDVRSTL